MPITTEIKDRIAEIVFDVPPVNAFDSETWMSLPAIITAAGRSLPGCAMGSANASFGHSS